MSNWCERWDMPTDSCAHCRGVTAPNIDSARVSDTPPPARAVVVVSGRRAGKTALSDLQRLLVDTAALYAELGDSLTGTRSGGDGERTTGGSVEKPLPLQADVAEHRHLLLRGLRYWVGKLATTTPTSSVPALVAFLTGNVHRLSLADQGELRTNLLEWRTGTTSRMDLPTLRGSLHLGDCPNKAHEHFACTGGLRVQLPADRTRSPWLSCTACKTRWAVTDLPAAADVRLPLSALAELCQVPVRTLQWRVQNDRLAASGGYARLGDVLRSECAETGIVPV